MCIQEWLWTKKEEACVSQWDLFGVPVLIWPMDEDPDRSFFGNVNYWIELSMTSLAAVQYKLGKIDDAKTNINRYLELVNDEDIGEIIDDSDLIYLEQIIQERTSFEIKTVL